MMIKSGISELSKKADSRYTLVTMAAKRARMIGENSEMEIEDGIKPVSRAVQEIADGRVQYCRGDEAFEGTYMHDGAAAFTTSAEPSSDLNLEALRYELEAEAEKKAIEERKRLENETAHTDGSEAE